MFSWKVFDPTGRKWLSVMGMSHKSNCEPRQQLLGENRFNFTDEIK